MSEDTVPPQADQPVPDPTTPPDPQTGRGDGTPGALDLLRGLGRGLATTARTLARPAHTQQYPHVEPDLPERSHGVIALLEENCTSCMLCARECPSWCIYIDSHKETLEPTVEGGRARQHNVLDRFDLDFSLCMYCGICVEVCPFDALFWAPDFAYAEGDIRNLLHGKARLGSWMTGVPDAALPPGYTRPVSTQDAAADISGDAVADTAGDAVADTAGDAVADTAGDTASDADPAGPAAASTPEPGRETDE